MKHSSQIHRFALVCLVFTFCSQAFGYVDPGSGHLLWQLVMALVMGGMFYVGKVRTLLQKLFRSQTAKQARKAELELEKN